MTVSKEKFSDYGDALSTVLVENKQALKQVLEENNKTIQEKTEKQLEHERKIVETYEKRLEKYEGGVLKTTSTNKSKIEKTTKTHKANQKQIDAKKVKNLQDLQKAFKEEKSKLSDGLKTLEKDYMQDESNCLNEVDKLNKKVTTFNVENLISRSEKKSKNKIKDIQSKLEQSLSKELHYPENILCFINKLKHIQANLEMNKVDYDSRIDKLNNRIKKEDLNYQAEVGAYEQNKLREEIKATYDLDKISINYAYNITHEALKTNQSKIDFDYKIACEQEAFNHFIETEEMGINRHFQLEDEKIALQKIIQNDFVDKIKNNFDLSDNQQQHLFDFEKSIKISKDTQDDTHYKLSIEEIDQRTSNLLKQVNVLTSQLKEDLNTVVHQIKTSLKTELKMPENQIKLINQKYKSDGNKLAKQHEQDMLSIKAQLALLDSTYDQQKIKELKASSEELEQSYQKDAHKLEETYNKELLAYNNKISYANERANKAIEQANNLYESQLSLYNEEIKVIKTNSEVEKNRAKKLSESMKALNNENLQGFQELNDLAITQNIELVAYLTSYSDTLISIEESDVERKKANLQSNHEKQLKLEDELLKKKKAEHQEALKTLDLKLDTYKKMINKKMDLEKKDTQKCLSKLDKELKNDLSSISKKHQKTISLFNVAMKDSESEYTNRNNTLTKEQTQMINQLKALAVKENIVISELDYDIHSDTVQKKSHVEVVKEEKKDVQENLEALFASEVTEEAPKQTNKVIEETPQQVDNNEQNQSIDSEPVTLPTE